MWIKRKACSLMVECKLLQSLWITVKRCLKALKIELPYDPGIPYHGESKKKTWKDT